MRSFRWRIAQYFEKMWWRRYLRGKDHNEYLQWKQNYWQGFLAEISDSVKPLGNQSFLDMGCGPAGIFMVLPGKVTAVDPLLNKYRDDLTHFIPQNFKHVTFHQSRAEDFDSPGQFDVVFSLNFINHVTDIRLTLRNLTKWCKADGKLVISADAHKYTFLRTLFRFLHFDILHPHQLTAEEYKKMIESEGFRIQCVKDLQKSFIFDYIVIVAEKY